MPLPWSGIAVGDGNVGTQWSALQSAVVGAVSGRADVITQTATVATKQAADTAAAAVVVTKQAAYDAALAAWIAAESPPSGAEFDAKEAALGELEDAQDAKAVTAGELFSAQADLESVVAATALSEINLTENRKAFGRAVADYALILGEATDYGPPTSPARIYDLIYQVAFGLAPTF